MTTTGIMHELGQTGDVRTMWDANDPQEVAAAREQFRALTGNGFLAYRAEGDKGTRGTQIKEFDPAAERIILVKPLAGG